MIDPVAFSLFGIPIYWYGLIYVLSFCFSWWFVLKYFRDFDIDLDKGKLENILIFTMIFGILGGRLIYCFFYNPLYYFSNPLEIVRVDQGGLSIFGGLLGGVFSLWFFSKKYGVSFLKLTDLFCIPIALSVSFGRFGNYINQELVGIVTTSSFGVVFPLFDNQRRLPYQIFASLKNLLVFQILLFCKAFNFVRESGYLTYLFLVLFCFGRFFLDFIRYEPSAIVFGLNIGQWFSLIVGVLALILLFKKMRG